MEEITICYVKETVEQEGFAYAFHGYSDFKECKDERFHELRLAYIKACKDLGDYLNVGYQD